MNPEQEIGRQLGEDGVANVVAKAEQYCAHEERHIALESHATIVQVKAQLSLLVEEEQRVREQLHQAPAPANLRHHLRKKVMASAVAAILTIAGFCLLVITFAPFELGWMAYAFCVGIAVIVPFLIDRLLEDPRLEPVISGVTAVAAAAGIASLMLLAGIRGTLLAHEVQSPPSVVIDDAQPEQQAAADDFYAKTVNALRLATVLLSLAMELGAGIALRDAMAASPHDPDEWKRLRGELALIRTQMIALAGKITWLEDGPARFHARFWRDFYRSMLTQTARSAMTKLLMLMALLATASQIRASGMEHLDLVVAIDLSMSVASEGPDAKTEFQKNVDGVAGVLAQIPAGSHITIIGITDRSFVQPYILLSASVPDDPGHFGERLTAARQTLTTVWKQRSAKLTPQYPATDIVGALEIAGQIFDQRPNGDKRVFVLFSDMLNHTKELDLESQAGVVAAGGHLSAGELPVPDIRNVSVYALGVDGAGGTLSSWQRVERFWQQYLQRCGASIAEYSVLRTTILR